MPLRLPAPSERRLGTNLVPNLVPTSADLAAPERTEAEPKPRFRPELHLNPTDLKTVGRESVPWVRIPAPPLNQAS